MRITMRMLSLFLVLMIVGTAQAEELFLLDKIEVVISGKEEREIITRSDSERPSLSGEFRALDDLVFERAVLLDAKQHKISSDDEAVDAYIAQVQRENNLSQKDLETIFTSAGYT